MTRIAARKAGGHHLAAAVRGCDAERRVVAHAPGGRARWRPAHPTRSASASPAPSPWCRTLRQARTTREAHTLRRRNSSGTNDLSFPSVMLMRLVPLGTGRDRRYAVFLT